MKNSSVLADNKQSSELSEPDWLWDLFLRFEFNRKDSGLSQLLCIVERLISLFLSTLHNAHATVSSTKKILFKIVLSSMDDLVTLNVQ